MDEYRDAIASCCRQLRLSANLVDNAMSQSGESHQEYLYNLLSEEIRYRKLCFLRFQGCRFFFGLLQSRLLLFQFSLQSVNVGGDGCDLGIQRHNNLLLLYDLGWLVFNSVLFNHAFPILFQFYSEQNCKSMISQPAPHT